MCIIHTLKPQFVGNVFLIFMIVVIKIQNVSVDVNLIEKK